MPTEITEFNPGVKASVCAEEIERCLAVVVFVCFVHFRLGKDDQAGAAVVPFELNLDRPPMLLRQELDRDDAVLGRVEVGNVVHSNCGRLTLVLCERSRHRPPLLQRLTLRSGMKTAMEWFSPGEIAKSTTPSTRNLFHTLVKSWLS